MERQIFDGRIPHEKIEDDRSDSRKGKYAENDSLRFRREALQEKIQAYDQAYTQN
jgi:hypothetical protein